MQENPLEAYLDFGLRPWISDTIRALLQTRRTTIKI